MTRLGLGLVAGTIALVLAAFFMAAVDEAQAGRPGLLIVLGAIGGLVIVVALVIFASGCLLSSQISQAEERRRGGP